MKNDRRSFIKNAAICTIAGLALPELASAAFAEAKGKTISLDVNDIVLFQGDSITDAGRDKDPLQRVQVIRGELQVAA